MNSFYKDAHTLFKELAKKIADKSIVSDMDAIHNSLLFALGIEKMLKGILYDINPVYILEDAEFKNAFPVFHKDKLIKSNENTKDIKQEPNEDVIAFHNCVIRATLVSQSAYDHKNTLMRLKNARDIIVHNSFDKLNIAELQIFLNRDFYVILKAFSDELNWSEIHCFNNLHSKLALIASTLEEDIEKKINLKLEASLGVWNVTKNQNLNRCKRITRELLLKDDHAYPTVCPCCKNNAVVFTKIIMDYNQYLKKEIQVGLDILKLQCGYCNLTVDDYKELDILKVKPNIDDKSSILAELEPAINKDTGTASKGNPKLVLSNTEEKEDKPVSITGDNIQEVNKPDEREIKGRT